MFKPRTRATLTPLFFEIVADHFHAVYSQQTPCCSGWRPRFRGSAEKRFGCQCGWESPRLLTKSREGFTHRADNGCLYPSALITINRIQEQLRLGFESGKTTTEVSSRPGPVEMPIRRCNSPHAHHIGSRRTRHLALTGFESFCPAMEQGPSRLARGQAIASYLNSGSFITLVPPVGRFGSGYRAVGRGSLVRGLSLQLCDSSSGSVRDGDLGAKIRRSVIV